MDLAMIKVAWHPVVGGIGLHCTVCKWWHFWSGADGPDVRVALVAALGHVLDHQAEHPDDVDVSVGPIVPPIFSGDTPRGTPAPCPSLSPRAEPPLFSPDSDNP
jgi:hypothetical protein